MIKWFGRIRSTGGFRKAFVRYITKGRSNRSVGGTAFLLLFILAFAIFAVFPVAFMVGNAFKPMRELYRYPPTVLPQNPTGQNFKDLLVYASESLVPFTRYLYNTGVLVILGCLGQILLSAMAAFPLAKSEFRGKKLMSSMVVYALMFSGAVTAVPNYLILTKLGLVDSLWAIILPSFASTLGLYLMQNFMEMLPDSLIEAAKIDGATPVQSFMHVTIPAISPTTFYLLITGIIGALQEFARPQIISGSGGPDNVGVTVVFYLYRNAFQYYQMGIASATAWLLAIIIVVLTIFNFAISKLWVKYD